jgi:hypothetical protein
VHMGNLALVLVQDFKRPGKDRQRAFHLDKYRPVFTILLFRNCMEGNFLQPDINICNFTMNSVTKRRPHATQRTV